MNILKLAAQLSLDGTRFKAGLKEAEVGASKFAGNVGSALKSQLAGAFGAGALIAFGVHAVKATADLQDLAEQSMMTTDQVQKLKAAAEDSGLTFEDLFSSQRKFASQRKEAAEGNENLRESFAKMGMSLEDLNNPGIGFIDFLVKAESALSKMTITEKRNSINELGEVLGKVGPRLTGFLKAAQESSGEFMASPAAIARLDALGDAWGRVGRQAKAAVAEMAAESTMPKSGASMLEGLLPGLAKLSLDAFRAFTKKETLGPPAPTEEQMSQMQAGTKPLFTDKAAEKRAKERQDQAEKDAAKFQEDRAKFNLKNMSPDAQRATIEEQLRQQMSVMGPVDQRQVIDLLNQLPAAQSFSRPAAASLTQSGQWSGRNFVNGGGDSGVVKAAKELLKPAQETAKAVTELNAKTKAGKTLNARI
jgi:hypothetical protein